MIHYQQVIKNALAAGYTISVWDGEDWQVKRSTKYRDILDAARSVDMAQLLIRSDGKELGTVAVIGYHSKAAAVADGEDDSVVDYTAAPEIEALIEG